VCENRRFPDCFDFCLALKRKIRLCARPESGCCVGAAVVLGCVAVTQIIRKLEEPVSVRCGMQPKYRIAARQKSRYLLQISLLKLLIQTRKLNLWLECHYHWLRNSWLMVAPGVCLYLHLLYSAFSGLILSASAAHECHTCTGTDTHRLADTDTDTDTIAHLLANHLPVDWAEKRASESAACGCVGEREYLCESLVLQCDSKQPVVVEIPIPALIRSNATIARGCISQNNRTERYKPGTKDIRPRSVEELKRIHSSAQNIQKQLSRSRSPKRFSFSQRERTLRIRLRIQQVRVKEV